MPSLSIIKKDDFYFLQLKKSLKRMIEKKQLNYLFCNVKNYSMNLI